MYLDKCLKEIRDRMAEATRRHGLNPVLHKGQRGGYVLLFQRADEDGVTWRSPVSFIFPSQEKVKNSELTIENVRLGIGRSFVDSIGTNGWKYFSDCWIDLRGRPIRKWAATSSADAAFDEAGRALVELPPFPVGGVARMVTDNDSMDFTWDLFKEDYHFDEVEFVDVWRSDDGFEEGLSMSYLGSRVDVTYRSDSVRISVDGSEVWKSDSCCGLEAYRALALELNGLEFDKGPRQ